MDDLKKQVEEKIKEVYKEDGVQIENVKFIGELVDIHKDLANEEYWEKKKEVMDMNYREYGNYGNEGYGARRRDSRGRYMERGRGGNYRGHEMLEEMQEQYNMYNEGKNMYGNDQETMKSFKYMLKAFKDYYKHLKQEASSHEEIQMLEETAREMLEM